MKYVKMAQLLIILVCLTAYLIGSAQTDYVVTVKGDTVTGKVKYLSYGAEKKVQVTASNNKKTIYSLVQAKGFSMDNELYRTVRTPSGYTFMKLLKDGYLSLYAYQAENQATWDGRYLLKIDGSGMDVPNLGFKKNLSRFLSDCDEVVNGLESKELTKSKIGDIIDEYNECVEKRTLKSIPTIQPTVDPQKLSVWIELEKAVKECDDFGSKETALEIIPEIKSKIERKEKVPNFLIDGLKNALKEQPHLQETLEKALVELK